jgi:hypothetical protein
MHVSWDDMFVFVSVLQRLRRQTILILFIVTYGHHQLLVSLLFSHYLWTFPLHLKSDTFTTLSNFFAYVSTQFGTRVKVVQSDNGKEFDNSSARTFFLTHGILFRMSCPYTSLQNGKAERIIRTTNDVIRSLLFQASMPPSYWAEALHTATLLLNIFESRLEGGE